MKIYHKFRIARKQSDPFQTETYEANVQCGLALNLKFIVKNKIAYSFDISSRYSENSGFNLSISNKKSHYIMFYCRRFLLFRRIMNDLNNKLNNVQAVCVYCGF